MRKIVFMAFIVVVLAALIGCNKTDPIHNGDPVDTSYANNFPLDKFHEFGQAGDTLAQKKLVNEYRRQLTANVVKHYPEIKDEKNVHFFLGSGFAEDVLTGSGETNSGDFENELIIVIDDQEVKDTLFLACGNGMLKPLRMEDCHDFGIAERWRFTIKKGEGLAHHLPALQEWGKVAGNLSIPIKDKNGKVVSQETYLNYLGKYQSLLFEGDVIDLLAGKVYNKAGQEVEFQRRQAETKKANMKHKRR